jgi:hypothetical protein
MTMVILSDIPTLFLFPAIILVSYLTLRVFTPPNPTPTNSTAKDRIFLYSPNFIVARQLFVLLLGAYHGYIVLTYPSPPKFCPRSKDLNPNLFTWSTTSIIDSSTNSPFGFQATRSEFHVQACAAKEFSYIWIV